MSYQQPSSEIELYLTQVLTGFEVIPANFGWHIYQGDTYYRLLQYQEAQGWQGTALSELPLGIKEELNKFALHMHSAIDFTQVA